jgi:hypothetical protein
MRGIRDVFRGTRGVLWGGRMYGMCGLYIWRGGSCMILGRGGRLAWVGEVLGWVWSWWVYHFAGIYWSMCILSLTSPLTLLSQNVVFDVGVLLRLLLKKGLSFLFGFFVPLTPSLTAVLSERCASSRLSWVMGFKYIFPMSKVGASAILFKVNPRRADPADKGFTVPSWCIILLTCK